MNFTRMVDLPDGCRLAVHHFVRSGPVLLFLHANGFPSGTYRQLVHKLQELLCEMLFGQIQIFLQEFEVFAVDLRGQGDSTRGSVKAKLGVEQHSADVLHLMSHFHLAGHVVRWIC